jgi:hypothetical protein
MLYKRHERRRKPSPGIEGAERGRPSDNKRRVGGARFTALSFLVIGICLIFIKISNPDADMRAPALMLVMIGLACAIMSYMARR